MSRSNRPSRKQRRRLRREARRHGFGDLTAYLKWAARNGVHTVGHWRRWWGEVIDGGRR